MAETSPLSSQLRLLILSPRPSTGSDPSVFPPVLQSLTGESPSADLTMFAGYTSHPSLVLRTKYYSRQVSLWCDELPPASNRGHNVEEASASDAEIPVSKQKSDDDVSDEALNLQQWQEAMLSSAASEVRAVMGGIVLILPVSTSRSSTESQLDSFVPYLRAAHALREAIEDESMGRDVASVIVLQHSQSTVSPESESKAKEALKALAEALESRTIDNDMFGWDVACCSMQADQLECDVNFGERNEFGEKLGMARVIEVLEGIDWAASAIVDEEDDDGDDGSGMLGNDHFKGLDHELQQEMLGLKLSMLDGDKQANEASEGEDMSSEQMDNLKSRVLAIRDTVAGMPQAQKRPSRRERLIRSRETFD